MALRAYQSETIARALQLERAMLIAPMGAGKTRIALEWARELLAARKATRVLVLAPRRVAEHVWPDEAAAINVPCSSALGSPAKREKLWAASSGRIVSASTASTVWWAQRIDRKTAVIIDESTMFKSSSAKRTRALAKAIAKCRYRLALTGTPTPNSLIDIWAQMRLVDSAVLGPKGKFLQQHFYAYSRPGMQWVEYVPKPGVAERIADAVAPRTIRIAPSFGALERVDVTIPVELPEHARVTYKRLVRHGIAGDITTANAGVLAGKLRQWAQGRCYDDKGRAHYIHDAKLDALAGVLGEADDNVIVVTAYRHDEDAIINQLGALPATRPGILDAWSRRKVKLMAIHPASAGHGLNLQQGGSIIVWYGLPWSLEHWEQTNARLIRPGQRRTVRVVKLVATGTIDEVVVQALESKQNVQRHFIQSLST